jgi:hypothetical protein
MADQPLQIQPDAADRALTPEQARFNTLVRDVATWRAALAQWKAAGERYQQAVEPVRRELHAAWRQWVFALDTASLMPGLSRAERAQLGELLRETATALLGVEGDAEIASVLGRHAEDAVDEVRAGDGDSRLALESAADVAGQAPTEDEGLEDLAENWRQQADAAAAAREQRAASRRAARVRQRHTTEAQEVSQSLRDVYRRLASALHPDRETDAIERERKTSLMQQANQAYADDNLLALLELQLQAEQVDMARLAALDQRRLQHYITVLQGQLAELQSETRRLASQLGSSAGTAPGSGLPRKLDRLVATEAQVLRGELLQLRRQARLLADVDATRSWLREQRKG